MKEAIEQYIDNFIYINRDKEIGEIFSNIKKLTNEEREILKLAIQIKQL